jgi:hypothetical protein
MWLDEFSLAIAASKLLFEPVKSRAIAFDQAGRSGKELQYHE